MIIVKWWLQFSTGTPHFWGRKKKLQILRERKYVLFLEVFLGDGVISFSECFHVHRTKILELLGNRRWKMGKKLAKQTGTSLLSSWRGIKPCEWKILNNLETWMTAILRGYPFLTTFQSEVGWSSYNLPRDIYFENHWSPQITGSLQTEQLNWRKIDSTQKLIR